MRPGEATLLLLNLPALAWCLAARPVPVWARALSGAALLVLLAHVVVEGYRWQILPGYLVTVWAFAALASPRVAPPGPWTGACWLGLALAAAVMGTVLPVFTLPKPTGRFPVGTATRHLVDPSREETRGGRPGARRELLVQLWYPAQGAGPRQAYRGPAEVAFPKEHFALVQTHAAARAPLAEALPRYPVVLFAPSWIGRRNQNTVQAEELASHGFVVVGIDHPYGTDLTVFPDGRAARTTLGEVLDCSSDEAFAASERAAEAELRVRAADVRFVLDELERLNESDPEGALTGRLDTARVGVFGHSFGGAVAAEVCRADARFKAGINLDGLLFGADRDKEIGKPFLVFSDGTPVPTAAELEAATGATRRLLTAVARDVERLHRCLPRPGGYLLTLRGAAHMNFCDSPLFSPLRRLTHAGRIPPRRAAAIVNDYVVSFFEAYLNGKDEPLLGGGASPYPEVETEPLPAEKPATGPGAPPPDGPGKEQP
jgi:predicted dienelactone hydrolase